MRIGLLADPDGWYARDLRRAGNIAYDLTILSFENLVARVGPTGAAPTVTAGEIDLATFDAVLVRTMPPGSLEQVVFRMDALAILEAQGTVVLNPPKAIEAAVDKYLTSARLALAGLPTPRTIACQTLDDSLAAYETLGRDVVVKPLFGGEGRGLMRLNDPDLAWRAFKLLTSHQSVVYVQEFIPHAGFDVRVFVLGTRIWAMRRTSTDDWRTNVSRGAVVEAIDLDDELVALARRAAACVGATIAGVDLLRRERGDWTVLEVNAVPGWKGLAKAHGRDIARLVLDFARDCVNERRAALPTRSTPAGSASA
jgi:RimK family alpha-L-glutamate ligase